MVTAMNPRAIRERRLSLDGTWEVQLEPDAPFAPIRVPFTFESALSGIGRPDEIHEHLRYRRTLRVPEAWSGSHVLLQFAGVDWRADVTLDGRRVGSHTGGYTSFCVDLGKLDPARDHEVVVDVEDPADGPQPRGKQRGSGGIWYTRATGIWRPVWAEAAPAAYIERFTLDATIDGVVRARVATTEPVDVELRLDGTSVTFRTRSRSASTNRASGAPSTRRSTTWSSRRRAATSSPRTSRSARSSGAGARCS
jgi:beta-galactosidase/beta-glucuronidase